MFAVKIGGAITFQIGNYYSAILKTLVTRAGYLEYVLARKMFYPATQWEFLQKYYGKLAGSLMLLKE